MDGWVRVEKREFWGEWVTEKIYREILVKKVKFLYWGHIYTKVNSRCSKDLNIFKN